MENVQNFTFIELRITLTLLSFLRCELAQSQTVILDDLARVKAVLLLIRTFLAENDDAQLFRPQIFDEKNRLLQQNFKTELETDLHFK